jgi:anti-sigma-K factor RskA
MTGPRPTCTRTEQAVGWALHALEPDEEIIVERHVPTCPDCSAAVRDTQDVMTQLATAVEQVDPPARLRASILDAAAATPQVRPQVVAQPPSPGPRQPRTARPTGAAGPTGPAGPAPGGRGPAPGGPRPTGPQPAGRSRRLSPGRLVTAAVAAVAIVAAGGLGIRTVQLQQQTVQLQQQLDTASSQVTSTTALVQSLARPGNSHALLAKPDGTAVAAVVLAGNQRTVYTIGLAANSADQTYVLWGLKDAAAAPEPLGVFDVDQSAATPQTVGSSGAQPFGAYAISLEPGRTPPAVPTDVVASGALTA